MAGKTDSGGQRPKVVFFGSGPVAAACLELLTEWCDVEAVITKPQPPHHRQTFPVIAIAEEHQLRTLFASNRRELDALLNDENFESTAGILIDYGIIVSQAVIDSFPLGIINSHFSLLPEWRGADPISFSILSGQQQTGVSLMLLVQAMDEGPILGQGLYDIKPDETTPSLTEELIKLSDGLLAGIVPAYLHLQGGPTAETGQAVIARSQEQVMQMFGRPFKPTYSRKLSKEDSLLDFTKPAVQLEREIRAFAEWPKSRTTIAGKDVVITAARVTHEPPGGDAGSTSVGSAYATPDKKIAIVTTDGLLIVDKLKPAGKPEMGSDAFLAGNKLA